MSSDETYGGPSGANNSTIEYAENAIVDGVSAKKVFPINLPPTAQTNPSTALSYDVNGDLQYIDVTIGATTYRTTLTYVARVLTGISAAVAL